MKNKRLLVADVKFCHLDRTSYRGYREQPSNLDSKSRPCIC